MHAQAQATLNANAMATALVTSHFLPFTKVAFTDPLTSSSDSKWSAKSACKASSTGYQVSVAQVGYYQPCPQLSLTFNDFAFQVNKAIQSGDCGGIIFREVDAKNFYMVLVCSDGTYDFGRFQNGNPLWTYNLSHSQTSSAIHQGTGQQNVIAVVVQGNTFNLYVNDLTNHIKTFTDNTFSQGSIALVANDSTNPTSVVYTNAVVWTQ